MKKSVLLWLLLAIMSFATLQSQPYYLRGSAAPCGWGGNFTPTCQLTDPDGNGVFELTLTPGATGLQEFKIYNQANDSWYPGDNVWYNSAGGPITFKFTPANNQVDVVDGSQSVCAPGDWTTPNWTNTTPMTNVSGNTWCITVPNPGTYSWKPTRCGTWNSWQQFDGTRSVNSANWVFTTTTPNQQICVNYDPATGRTTGTTPPPTGYYLRGSAGPCDWFGNFTPTCELTDPDGDGCFELVVDYGSTPIGLHEFKIYHAATNTWYPNGANAWFRHTGGSVRFRYCSGSNEVFAIDNFNGNICAPGSMNGWNNQASMESYGNGTFCTRIATPGTYEWKPTFCGTWNSWQPTNGERSTGADNWRITTTIPNQQVCVTYDSTTGNVRAGGTNVPTMTQWGIFLFGLLVATFGLVTLRQRRLAVAGANLNFSISNLGINKASWMRTTISVLSLFVIAFSIAVSFFGYSLTQADLPGILLASPLIAYMISLVRSER